MALQSYGGFVAAHVLGDEHSDVFSCGVAVSAPSDFYYYGESLLNNNNNNNKTVENHVGRYTYLQILLTRNATLVWRVKTRTLADMT